MVWPLLLYGAEKREETVSPIALLFQAWTQPGRDVFRFVAPMLVIPVAAWLIGFFWLFRRYLKEKADSKQRM